MEIINGNNQIHSKFSWMQCDFTRKHIADHLNGIQFYQKTSKPLSNQWNTFMEKESVAFHCMLVAFRKVVMLWATDGISTKKKGINRIPMHVHWIQCDITGKQGTQWHC